MRLWDVETGRCLRVLEGHTDWIQEVAWSADGRYALSGGEYGAVDETVRLWEVETGRCLRVLKGHVNAIWSVAWSPDQRLALSGSADGTVRLWDVETGICLRVLEGHRDGVPWIAWSADGRRALSGSHDNTVRLWDLKTGRCLRVLEGHTDTVVTGAWSADQRFALSGSEDKTVRLWDVETGRCLRVLEGHEGGVMSVAWSADQRRAFSGDIDGDIRVWDLSEFAAEERDTRCPCPIRTGSSPIHQRQGPPRRRERRGQDGAFQAAGRPDNGNPATRRSAPGPRSGSCPVASGQGVEREIWLWDFGGQADQRLIHQLYMDETALAVLVFDGQKEDLFETLGQWDRDLTRASRKEFAKLLVAGRVDAGGLRVSRTEVEKFARERKLRRVSWRRAPRRKLAARNSSRPFSTASSGTIIPCRTTEVLFKRLKEEIVRLKDEGRVLMRFNELRETLQLRFSGESLRFTDEELHAVLTLLAGPGVVWELKFGSWVLLQPERINAYAQAVIRTLQADEHERGCLMEERVLKGDLTYESSMTRLDRRRGTIRPAGHAPDAGGARPLPAATDGQGESADLSQLLPPRTAGAW